MTGTLFYGIFFGFICACKCYTEEDIKACQDDTFGSIVCTSVSFYRECLVPGADQVHAIKLNKNFTRARCEFKKTFGYRGKSIWVSGGCSGEFYLCYEGAEQPNTRPVTSVPVRTTKRDVAVISASSIKENNIWIYVIVAAGVVVLVGIGLIIGCVVKRRQQNDKSRQLAEKRQIRIELKEHRENMEEHGVTMVPIANRSLSLESINYGDSINYSYGIRHETEKEGSVCSSRSSNSGMTSMSARTTGYLMKSRPTIHGSMRRMHGRILKKGISTPDISVLGKMYPDASINSKYHRGSLRRQSKNSLVRGSQSSLESVREVSNKYKVFDIPLNEKIQHQYKRPSKYNTVSFGVGSSQRIYDSRIYSLPENSHKNSEIGFAGSAHEQAYRYSMRSLPGSSRNSRRASNRRVTRAIVHSRSPNVKDMSGNIPKGPDAANDVTDTIILQRSNSSLEQPHKVNQTHEMPRDIQYHDPTSLIIRPRTPEPRGTLKCKNERSESPISVISKAESIYEIVDKLKVNKPKILPKPKLLPKPNTASTIYATVNKSYFKAASKAGKKDDVVFSTFDVMSMEDDEDDAISAERESQYARPEAFKSTSTFTVNVPSIPLPGVSTGDTKI